MKSIDPSEVLPQPDILDQLFARIDLPTMRGLEIGALHNPRVRRHQGNIRYLDHASKEGLRKKYANDQDAASQAHNLVDVDYVIEPGQDIAEAIGDWGPVDYVIASHVIEHLPNPVGWLAQVEKVLVDGGVLSLVIPDKRYCFDAKRQVTTLAQFIGNYLNKPLVATPCQIFDYESNLLKATTTEELWSGMDVSSIWRSDVKHPKSFALAKAEEQLVKQEYVDLHASTFTPASFVSLMGDLADMGLTGFAIGEIFPTDQGSYEFFTTLEKPRFGSEARLRDYQLSAAQAAKEKVAVIEAAIGTPQPPPPEPSPAPVSALGPISAKEEQLIKMKRSGMLALRKLSARLGRR